MAYYPYPGVPIVTEKGQTIKQILEKVLKSPKLVNLLMDTSLMGLPQH